MNMNDTVKTYAFFFVMLALFMLMFGRYPERVTVTPPIVTPTPITGIRFECKAIVVNPCRPRARVVAYGATCEEARVTLENDLKTIACAEVKK